MPFKQDCSDIILFWDGDLRQVSSSLLDHLDLESETSTYLQTVGLPANLNELNGVLDITFYFDKPDIRLNELDGISYCILGTDSGTELCVSLADQHLYSVDFNKLLGVDPVCFINSSIIKFIQAIQLFITFQEQSQINRDTEEELIAKMKQQMKLLDPKSLEDGNTWWSIVINQPY